MKGWLYVKRNIWREIKESFKQNKVLSIIMIILIIATWTVILSVMTYKDGKIEQMSYNDFLQCVDDGKVDTVYYNQTQEYMTVTFLNDITKTMDREQRDAYEYTNAEKRMVLYPGAESNFREEMLKHDVNVRVIGSSFWSVFFSLFGTLMFYVIFFVVILKLMNPAKGIKEVDLIQKSDVTFDDIIGHDEIIDDIKFITELIKNPDKGEKIGAKLPKGLLFAGPPGTGKTLLAKAIAHEASVPFLYQNASGLIEMYVGLGARRVRDLFKIARKNAPCVLFIDEIDAIGGSRNNSKGSSENDQTINALLQEMDGFSDREGIFMIAATNRADYLDEALVRSGRFDRQITVNPPRDWIVRKNLFEHYLGKFTVADDVNVTNFAKQTSGFTGADIAMICNEASIIAVMADKEAIDGACIEEAIDKKIFSGNRSKHEAHESDKNVVAYHEAGHAVMRYILKEPIARASIQSTTSGVGGAVFGEDTDTIFQTKSDYHNNLLILYAGRVSEEIKFDAITTGAQNDIKKATEIMLASIEEFGFDDDFGLLNVSVLSEKHLVDSKDITERMSRWSKKCYNECHDLLTKNYDKVELLAQELLASETLTGEQITELFMNKAKE